MGMPEAEARVTLQHSLDVLKAGDLVAALRRRIISEDEYKKWMARTGLSPDQRAALERLSEAVLSPGDAVALFRRGKISLDEYQDVMWAHGYRVADAMRIYDLSWQIPSAQHLIAWAACGATDERIAGILGLDGEIESVDMTAMVRAGIHPDMARMLWRSHWALPSWAQISEMYRRGFIPDEMLDIWMSCANIAPGWRPALKATLTEPFGKRDIRQMYDLGVIDYAEMIRAYRRIGYSEQDARGMADYAVAQSQADTRAAMKPLVRDAVVEGSLDSDEARRMLEGVGYQPDVAELMVIGWQAERDAKVISEQISSITGQYVRGAIDEMSMRDAIARLPTSDARKTSAVESALAARAKVRALPERADVLRWLKKGMLSPDDARDRLRAMRYDERDIEMYISEIVGGSA